METSKTRNEMPAHGGATLIGWFLGVLIDRWLHTTWVYIAGLVLGMVTGFVELIRMLLSETKAETKIENK